MRYYILCNEASFLDAGIKPATDSKILEVTEKPPHSNLRLELKNITHKILSNLNPVASDLLEIAAFVYWADNSVSRGTDKEVFGANWKRDFTFVIPVRKLDIWQSPLIQEKLIDTLTYLTGDNYTFNFVQSEGLPEQLIFKDLKDAVPWCPESDMISLFSGGLDSLAGAIHLYKQGKRPILVSHRSMPGIDSRQKLLVKNLKKCIQMWQFPHLSVWVHRRQESAIEHSQRSRGFLYLALATTVGQEINIYEIGVCENGIVTFNLPRAGHTPGTFRSRSTDPGFLARFSHLVSLIFEHQFNILNPFLFLTRAEVINTIKEAGYENLVPASTSCTRTRRSFSKLHPHCGTCYQCVDRRFAVAYAGIENTDELVTYEKDLFINELDEGDERTCAENTVRFSRAIKNSSPESFLISYPELYDSLYSISEDTDEVTLKIYDLHQRFALEIYSVLSTKLAHYSETMIEGKLPDSCLLSMVGRQEHLIEPTERYARKIAVICQDAVKHDFKSHKPESEIEVQDAIEGALAAAAERLNRESPMLSYIVVQTKPDFSSKDNMLFIEVKYVPERRRLNRIITEITSRITIYRDQKADVLFLIYDADQFITDDEAFISELEKHSGIYVAILKS